MLLGETKEDRSSDISHNTATALKRGTTFTEVVVVEVLSKRSSVFLQLWLIAFCRSPGIFDILLTIASLCTSDAAKHHGTTCLRKLDGGAEECKAGAAGGAKQAEMRSAGSASQRLPSITAITQVNETSSPSGKKK